jgi:hypothetical protein
MDGEPPAIDLDSNLFREALARLQKANGTFECSLRGGSMGAAIPAGSRIRISVVDASAYRVGQVIAFLAEGRLFVHRIVHRGRRKGARDWLVTKGDRCLLPDAPVALTSALGTVSVWSPADGSWLPPGPEDRGSPVARGLSWAAVLLLTGLLESDAQLAQWLIARLRPGVRFLRRLVQ